ncbi:hypothetical protein VHEMI05389 [[Torrubiella] hemipterigena]|uniref:N-acetyltransferase domain-containing protein n=1 Tax=[Torrubiella] hemipterigena TaxID=1531966 RepID=A0A0A1TGV4_9HYPO|nr:hypothetical protein VHEMI05389 [[Torrubiella] hemipterigena]
MSGYANVFTSDRLIYEPLDPKDSKTKDFYYSLKRDPNVDVFVDINVLSPRCRSDLDEKSWEDRMNADLFKAVICIKPDNWDELASQPGTSALRGIPIGFIVIFGSPATFASHRRGTLGISLSTQYHGKGYGTEALIYLRDWAFRFGNLHSLSLDVASFNEKAIGMYKKVGFVEEGRMREALYFDGEWRDALSMSILRQEWDEIQKKKNAAVQEK